jgi:hypothetical protein
VVREDAAGQPAPETMRRLMHAILAHQDGELQDDATAMLVEWQGGGAAASHPSRSKTPAAGAREPAVHPTA